MPERPLVLVVGGGAAGFFGAIHAAEGAPEARVVLLEATGTMLQKVRISGGGRCNVTQNLFDPAALAARYPRGAKEMRALLARFGPRETMRWFEERGVALKAEADGRVFPTTDDSETICSALLDAARRAGVELRAQDTVREIRSDGRGLAARRRAGEEERPAAILLATGSNPHGLALARSVGHAIVPGVPSLFTFELKDARLEGLAGVSVARARLQARFADSASLAEEGPVLVTHWGLSGPGVLRLSAWGARRFHAAGYRATLRVDWAPEANDDELRRRAEAARARQPNATVGAHGIAEGVPRRLWERLLVAAGCDPAKRWAEVSNRDVHRALDELKRGAYEVVGKGAFKEEFVTAGGVARREVDWRTMESALAPGLHLAGEILDVDALTGGYNLQNAWSTGWAAGRAIAARIAGTPAASL